MIEYVRIISIYRSFTIKLNIKMNLNDKILTESDIYGVGLLSESNLFISLILAFLLSNILGFIYKKYARTLSNHEGLANVFPLLSIVTTLVIAVVKSSLALSLGLVGALSIVRFRTPVKEPEELTYLFFSIALGLALGAEQYIAAFIGIGVGSFAIITNDKIRKRKKFISNNNLRILIDGIKTEEIDKFIGILKTHVEAIDFTNLIMKNFNNSSKLSMVLTVKSDQFSSITKMINIIKEDFQDCTFSIIDSEKI